MNEQERLTKNLDRSTKGWLYSDTVPWLLMIITELANWDETLLEVREPVSSLEKHWVVYVNNVLGQARNHLLNLNSSGLAQEYAGRYFDLVGLVSELEKSLTKSGKLLPSTLNGQLKDMIKDAFPSPDQSSRTLRSGS